jgi:antitoxin component YwqK of YwqJK toxin-antitoxin module
MAARYKNGKLPGTTKIFDKNENVIYEEVYFNGEKQ